MSTNRKVYVPPVVETIDSSEIIESIGPAQSYGHDLMTTGMLMDTQPRLHSGTGGR